MLAKNIRTAEKSSRKNNFADKPLTYKEFKEKEREMEASNLGPGAHEVQKPFGSDIKTKIDFGRKYEFKPNQNPPPGLYNVDDADRLVKPKGYEAYIDPGKARKADTLLDGTKARKDYEAEPGTGHLKEFGSGLNKVDMGSPYKFKPKEGPAPGQYE